MDIMNLKVLKRDGRIVDFNVTRIENAIYKAFLETQEYSTLEQLNNIKYVLAEAVEDEIHTTYNNNDIVNIETIQDEVESVLMRNGYLETAKAYIIYRHNRTQARKNDSISIKKFDSSINGLLDYTNIDVIDENSNKNSHLISTQRDLIAGEVSKDYLKRKVLPKDILDAHESCILHYHDLDYGIQKGCFNCCLINLEDMFTNGTVINNKLVETPKSFSTACTITTQIIAQIA